MLSIDHSWGRRHTKCLPGESFSQIHIYENSTTAQLNDFRRKLRSEVKLNLMWKLSKSLSAIIQRRNFLWAIHNGGLGFNIQGIVFKQIIQNDTKRCIQNTNDSLLKFKIKKVLNVLDISMSIIKLNQIIVKWSLSLYLAITCLECAKSLMNR